MKLDKNHPKLTAYALGDLPEKEMQAMKPFIEENPELLRIVLEISEFADAMNQGFALEKPSNFSKSKSDRLKNIPKQTTKKNIWIWSGVLAPIMVALFLLVNPETKDQFSQDTLWTSDSKMTLWESEEKSGPSSDTPKPARGSQKPETMATSDGLKPMERNLSSLGVGNGKVLSKPKGKSRQNGLKRLGSSGGVGQGLEGRGKMTNDFGVGNRSRSLSSGRNKPEVAQDKANFSRKTRLPFGPSLRNREIATDHNQFNYLAENNFVDAKLTPLSTFGVDVDTGSYSIARQYLNQGQRPPAESVRIEEYINYFDYGYEAPSDGRPFAVHLEAANAPWAEGHRLVRVGLKAKEVAASARKDANLVFLIDVSGSMSAQNKLPLLKESFKLLLRNLKPSDRVAIVVYAGASGLALPSTTVSDQNEIMQALDRLKAGGSTNGGSGIDLAYKIARKNFKKDGLNRVILATDGDFNVGLKSQGELVKRIQAEAESKVFLTVLGFGMGNLQDSTLELIANRGNGTYAFIDSEREADKIFSKQLAGTLETVAKDVKIQVEFNPNVVQSYRLIGYENRALAASDFNNDRKDAGDIGAGHSVTAIYEVIPVGAGNSGVDPLKYQDNEKSWLDIFKKSENQEMLTIKLRYKKPDEDQSQLFSKTLTDEGKNFSEASESFRFASAVAAFGMIMRDSSHKGTAKLSHVLKAASQSKHFDPNGYKREFLDLVTRAVQNTK